jgi:hypothetical protein
MKMKSPNEMVQAGMDMMLDGKEPVSLHDQVMLMAFLAANITPDVAQSACRLMKSLYPERFNLLTEAQVAYIVAEQVGS